MDIKGVFASMVYKFYLTKNRGRAIKTEIIQNEGKNGYQIFLVFVLMLSSLILDRNRKVTYWLLTGISSEKTEPFDTDLEPTMSNLANV